MAVDGTGNQEKQSPQQAGRSPGQGGLRGGPGFPQASWPWVIQNREWAAECTERGQQAQAGDGTKSVTPPRKRVRKR